MVKTDVQENRSLTIEELESTARMISTFINDEDVKNELMTFAIEETDFEIYKPLNSIYYKLLLVVYHLRLLRNFMKSFEVKIVQAVDQNYHQI